MLTVCFSLEIQQGYTRLEGNGTRHGISSARCNYLPIQ